MNVSPSTRKEHQRRRIIASIRPKQIVSEIEQRQLRKLINWSGHDLASRLKVSPADIILDTVVDKVWTDTSLNCPILFDRDRGMIQQTIKGWLIVWKLGQKRYQYHTSIGGRYVLCRTIEIPRNIHQQTNPSDL